MPQIKLGYWKRRDEVVVPVVWNSGKGNFPWCVIYLGQLDGYSNDGVLGGGGDGRFDLIEFIRPLDNHAIHDDQQFWDDTFKIALAKWTGASNMKTEIEIATACANQSCEARRARGQG
jgi:hypothetical protein